MFVVTGVTGHTGAVVAETLLARKQRVRVLVRTPEKGEVWKAKGAEVAVASLEDPRALAESLNGATGGYFLIPPNYTAVDYLKDRTQVADALAAAVSASRLPHAVFLSSIGAHLPAGTGPIQALHDGEVRLESVARSLTVLRASYFMETWIPVLGAARAQGLLPSFLPPKRKIPMVATLDVGRMAAECLLDQCKGSGSLNCPGMRITALRMSPRRWDTGLVAR
ncbi:MAG: NmrA family NAD(P)-binding protein [Nitrospiraceae bacterium]